MTAGESAALIVILAVGLAAYTLLLIQLAERWDRRRDRRSENTLPLVDRLYDKSHVRPVWPKSVDGLLDEDPSEAIR